MAAESALKKSVKGLSIVESLVRLPAFVYAKIIKPHFTKNKKSSPHSSHKHRYMHSE
jgi:hypothetical protein